MELPHILGAFKRSRLSSTVVRLAAAATVLMTFVLAPNFALASEANLKLPDLGMPVVGDITGKQLLYGGILVCLLGLGFGVMQMIQLKNLPVHKSMADISDLIWETCKTYLFTQMRFIFILQVCIGLVMVYYFAVLQHFDIGRVMIILLFSVIGILGSCGVAWFGIRV